MQRIKITGFTLMELLITISIMAILTAIAIPSFQSLMTQMRMDSEIHSLITDLSFGRSEAIKQGVVINVCPSTGQTCNSGTPLNWSSGWIVLNTTMAQPLRFTAGITHGDTMTSNMVSGASPTFSPVGYTQFSGFITLHDSNDDQSLRRCIQFNPGSWTLLTGASCP